MKDGGPAFPTDAPEERSYAQTVSAGMSLRDYFAAAALPQVQAAAMLLSSSSILSPADHAKIAYELADALLAEREKK